MTTRPQMSTLDLAARILDDSRASDIELRISVLMLRLPDQSERVVVYYPEYGDGDGRQRIADLMEELTPMLHPGEVLHVTERVVR